MIKIDEEFKNLIPPLREEEYLQLEQNIIQDGCRDPLVLWNDTIVDGHNRYKICTDNGIEFNTTAREFSDRDEVLEWMMYNQIGKRNAHANLMSYMRGKLYLQSKQNHGGDRKSKGQNVLLNTAEKIADNTNVSDKTIKRDAKFAQAVDVLSEYRTEILSGETERTKQEIVDIYEFAELKDKPYEVETHILYNNPDMLKEHTAIFKKINALVKKYKDYELKELVETDKVKEEDGREFKLFEAIPLDFSPLEKILEILEDNDINEVEKKLLTYVKNHVNISDSWRPVLSEEEYKAMMELEKEEHKLELKKLYTPKLINGDTLVEMTKLSSESIDLIITDPPYNMDKADWDSYGSAEEFADWMEIWLKECFRVLKPHGSIYVFGLNRMLSHVQMRMEKIGFNYKNWIIWDTVQGAGGGLWVNRQEAILYFSKSEDTYEDKDSIKLQRSEENIREYKGKTYEFKNPSNIWRFPAVDDKAEDRTSHPTQKPVELIERIVLANSKEGDKVLDCFMGSGSTGVACMKNKRMSIGIEMQNKYIKMANERFEKVEI